MQSGDTNVKLVQITAINTDISIAHVIIIIKSDVSTFPFDIIFVRGCVPEMFVVSYAVIYCIYIPGKLWFCLRCYSAIYDVCK